MTFTQAVAAHQRWLKSLDRKGDARKIILDFLEWDEPNEEEFGNEVRIVLVSANFSRELTTTVLWLNKECEVDISCMRLKVYRLGERLILDAQCIIPLPEAEEYTERVREKERAERQGAGTAKDYTRFDVTVGGELYEKQPKNRTMHLIIQGLCRGGVTPEEIAATVDWRTIWSSCAGTHTRDSFVRELSAQDQDFDDRRWFCEDVELIHSGGRTHALHSNWGGQRTIESIFELARRWPDRGITVERHANGDGEELAA